eukprot:433846-Rhodomonas_salina.1
MHRSTRVAPTPVPTPQNHQILHRPTNATPCTSLSGVSDTHTTSKPAIPDLKVVQFLNSEGIERLSAVVTTGSTRPSDSTVELWQIRAIQQFVHEKFKKSMNDDETHMLLHHTFVAIANLPEPHKRVVLNVDIIHNAISKHDSLMGPVWKRLSPTQCRFLLANIPNFFYPRVKRDNNTMLYDITQMYHQPSNEDIYSELLSIPNTPHTSAHATFAPPPTDDAGTLTTTATTAPVLAGAPATETVAVVILALAGAEAVARTGGSVARTGGGNVLRVLGKVGTSPQPTPRASNSRPPSRPSPLVSTRVAHNHCPENANLYPSAIFDALSEFTPVPIERKRLKTLLQTPVTEDMDTAALLHLEQKFADAYDQVYNELFYDDDEKTQ